MAYSGGMKAIVTKDMLLVDFDKGAPFEQRAAPTGVSTVRISLTSAAVCIAILAWAITNAYLSQS